MSQGPDQNAFGRAATDAEIAWCHSLLGEVSSMLEISAEEGLQRVEPWKELCHVVINRKEFIYVFNL